MPVSFDQYSNCGFKCLYCFSQFQRAIGTRSKDYQSMRVAAVSLPRFTGLFTEPGNHQGFGPYFRSKLVLQWGGLGDPFCPLERRFGVGLEILRFLHDLEYPVCFSTKGTWWLKDQRYVDLFRDSTFWNVKFSIITGDAAKARAVEHGCPPPAKRLRAIERFAKLGAGGATLRLRPFILGISDPSYVQLIRDAASAGATAVSTEFFCMEERTPSARVKYHEMSKVAGFDLVAFYRRYSVNRGYMRLNRNVKRDIINRMDETCREAGIRFYVSDAHFKERCANGSCCGLGPEWNYSRGQFAEALMIARDKGSVRWSDIEASAAHLAHGSCTALNMPSHAKTAQFGGRTLLEYLHFLWNSTNSAKSPYMYFEGVMVPSGIDERGDVIYSYDPARS